MFVFSVYLSFLISHVPPAHSFLKKTSTLENTAESLPTYFLTLTYYFFYTLSFPSGTFSLIFVWITLKNVIFTNTKISVPLLCQNK